MPLCVRVNSEASEKLRELSESESLPRWKMLTRIILSSLPKYSYHMDDDGKLNRHNWPEYLLKPEEKKVKYKGTTEQAQINSRITSTT